MCCAWLRCFDEYDDLLPRGMSFLLKWIGRASESGGTRPTAGRLCNNGEQTACVQREKSGKIDDYAVRGTRRATRNFMSSRKNFSDPLVRECRVSDNPAPFSQSHRPHFRTQKHTQNQPVLRNIRLKKSKPGFRKSTRDNLRRAAHFRAPLPRQICLPATDRSGANQCAVIRELLLQEVCIEARPRGCGGRRGFSSAAIKGLASLTPREFESHALRVRLGF